MKTPSIITAVACLATFLFLSHVSAEEKLVRGKDRIDAPAIGTGLCVHNLFQSGMVLQRDKPIRIWGWAEPGEKVTVAFAGQEQSAVAAADRAWKIELRAEKASTEPRRLVVRGKANTIERDNILVGDVWLLGGQSNMEFEIGRVEGGQLEIASANFKNIRLFSVPQLNGPDEQKAFPRMYQWSDWFPSPPPGAASRCRELFPSSIPAYRVPLDLSMVRLVPPGGSTEPGRRLRLTRLVTRFARAIPLGRLCFLPTPPRYACSLRPFHTLRFLMPPATARPLAELPVHNPHAAGIDVGDRSHWVCVGLTPAGDGIVREFPAHTPGLRDLVQWLREHQIATVAMEATGVYSSVLYLTLLEAGFETLITPPQFARQIQGRPKTDRRDCQWIYRLHTLGLLPRVFEPDDATQTLRDYVRQRANHVRLSGQHIQRMQKALTLMNLKLTNVVGDITGMTGMKIIRAIIAGERDATQLAKLRDRRCKHSAATMAIALDGRYRPEHVLELKLNLQVWEKYQDIIKVIDSSIDEQLTTMKKSTSLPPLPTRTRQRGRKPHDPHFDVRTALYYLIGLDLTQIDGIDEIHALTLISELGTDFTKWPTVKHFSSWLGLCPNWKKTGGKVKSSQTRKGKNRAARALRLAAWGLMRSKSYLGAYLRRQRSRLGAPKAITATAHKLARILYNMMRYGIEYMKKSESDYKEQERARQEKILHHRADQMGFELVKDEPKAAASEAPS